MELRAFRFAAFGGFVRDIRFTRHVLIILAWKLGAVSIVATAHEVSATVILRHLPLYSGHTGVAFETGHLRRALSEEEEVSRAHLLLRSRNLRVSDQERKSASNNHLVSDTAQNVQKERKGIVRGKVEEDASADGSREVDEEAESKDYFSTATDPPSIGLSLSSGRKASNGRSFRSEVLYNPESLYDVGDAATVFDELWQLKRLPLTSVVSQEKPSDITGNVASPLGILQPSKNEGYVSLAPSRTKSVDEETVLLLRRHINLMNESSQLPSFEIQKPVDKSEAQGRSKQHHDHIADVRLRPSPYDKVDWTVKTGVLLESNHWPTPSPTFDDWVAWPSHI